MALKQTLRVCLRASGGKGSGGFVHDTVTRFMGLIVIAMGVQFALTGLRSFMRETTQTLTYSDREPADSESKGALYNAQLQHLDDFRGHDLLGPHRGELRKRGWQKALDSACYELTLILAVSGNCLLEWCR